MFLPLRNPFFCAFISGREKGSPLKTPRKRHFGQLTEEDMSSPKRRKRAYEISQPTVTSNQKRINILQQTMRRKNLRIKSLVAMLSHLENKHLLDKDGTHQGIVVTQYSCGSPNVVINIISYIQNLF